MWPQQLEIRNEPTGMIWQVYHVNNQQEVDILSKNARDNGFSSIVLDPNLDCEETWPNWRDTDSWKECLEKNKVKS